MNKLWTSPQFYLLALEDLNVVQQAISQASPHYCIFINAHLHTQTIRTHVWRLVKGCWGKVSVGN